MRENIQIEITGKIYRKVLKWLFLNTEKTDLSLFCMFFVFSIFNNMHISYFL